VLQRLCGKEEIAPQDVVVLSSHGFEKSEVAKQGVGRFELVRDPRPLGPYVRFSSIRGFKGLESPVVVLCELEDLDDATLDQQLYVAISHARNHCVVIVPEA
jgi:superfamily I DNA/RNA helicase